MQGLLRFANNLLIGPNVLDDSPINVGENPWGEATAGEGGGTSRGLLSAVETGRNTERMPRSGAVPSGGGGSLP